MADDGSLSGNRLMLVLLFLVSMVSVVAVIVAAVSLTSSGSGTPNIKVNSGPGGSSNGGSSMPIVINSGSGGSGSNSLSGNRIFKIAIGHEFIGHQYLSEKGYVTGFSIDLINGVCDAGGMDCRIIWDRYQNCWTAEAGKHGTGGPGLFNGWYDAGSEWAQTVDRVQVFDFSMPSAKPPTYRIYTLKSNRNFDAGDVTGKKLGFIDGYSADEKCLARHPEIKGSTLPTEDVTIFPDVTSAVAALNDGKVDALLGNQVYYGTFPEVTEVRGPAITCALSGYSMMTTKGSDFNSYWNRAFQKFKDSGKFKQLCDQAQKDHGDMGGIIDCVDSP